MEEGLGSVALIIILLPANIAMTSLPVATMLRFTSSSTGDFGQYFFVKSKFI
jgi:hypothetical protein